MASRAIQLLQPLLQQRLGVGQVEQRQPQVEGRTDARLEPVAHLLFRFPKTVDGLSRQVDLLLCFGDREPRFDGLPGDRKLGAPKVRRRTLQVGQGGLAARTQPAP